MFNVLVHCVLQGTSLCFYSILAQGLSFVRIHFSFWNGVAAVDACAAGSYCQIGGFIRHHSGVQFWFSEKNSHADFEILSLHLDPNMQRSIASFETLAQIALVWLVATSFPGFRIPICLKSLSDNTGAESVSNKLFYYNSSSMSLCRDPHVPGFDYGY